MQIKGIYHLDRYFNGLTNMFILKKVVVNAGVRWSYLVQVLSKGGCVIVDIVHQHSDVGLALMNRVGWADSQSVPRPLLIVQKASQRHPSSITMNPKHALDVCIQV